MTFLDDVERLLAKQARREQWWWVAKVAMVVLGMAVAVALMEFAR